MRENYIEQHTPSIRVLHIIGVVAKGGVESVVMNYYRHINRNKVQFDFVIDGYNKTILDKEIENMGGYIYHIEPYRSNIFKYMKQIYSIIKTNNYSIVHCHMNSLALFSLFPAWLAGTKIRILHNHSSASKNEGLRTILKYILRPCAPIFANKYVACSQLAGRWMYGIKGMKSRHVKIINNAIDLNKFCFNNSVRKKFRHEFGITSNTLVIGHAGRFMYQKNHEFLLEMLQEIIKEKKDVRLVLIGDGELRAQMEKKVRLFHLDEKVLFLGLRNDMPSLYNLMDVFVLPSWYEGLPVVSVEAQANGLYCLVSNRVSKECKLTESLEFLPLELGPKAWADRILKVPIERNEHAVQDLQKNNFDICREANKILELYEA